MTFHAMKALSWSQLDGLDRATKVRRTENTCPCVRCRAWRRRRKQHLESPKTYTFEVIHYPHLADLLAALDRFNVDHRSKERT